jgi:hypothetical protein
MAHQRGSRENNDHRGTLFLIIYLRVLGRRWTIFVSTDVYDLTFKSILIQEAFFDITDCDEFQNIIEQELPNYIMYLVAF